MIVKLWALLPLVTCILIHTPLSPSYRLCLIRKEVKHPHLFAFHDNSEFSKVMEPVVKKVMEETGLHIELINIENKQKLYSCYKIYQLCQSNSIPLYYNLKTDYYIEGVTTFENLKSWALGKKPSNLAQVRLQSLEDASYRITGYWGRIQRIIRQIKLKGEEKMNKRCGIITTDELK